MLISCEPKKKKHFKNQRVGFFWVCFFLSSSISYMLESGVFTT